MKSLPKTRAVLTLGAAATLASVSCVAPSAAQLGFTVGVEGAPPPPGTVVVAPPSVAPVAGGVYVVTDPSVPYDLFRFGATWYLFNGAYWYRAADYRGPFAVVDVRYVPRQVLRVPGRHWKHHPHGGPPGHGRHGRDHG